MGIGLGRKACAYVDGASLRLGSRRLRIEQRALRTENICPMTLDDERQLEGSEPVFRGMAYWALGHRSFLEPETLIVFFWSSQLEWR